MHKYETIIYWSRGCSYIKNIKFQITRRNPTGREHRDFMSRLQEFVETE
jgi:hypothetical protein